MIRTLRTFMHIVAILYGVETHIERHTSTKHVIVIERSL